MGNEKSFDNDVKQENILTPIIVRDILGGYFKEQNLQYELIDFESGKNEQYAGIDFIMHNQDGKSWNVDVKCQTNEYINHPTNTFSIELNYIKGEIEKEGWFVKRDNQTDFYLFAWIHKAKLNESGLIESVGQIEKIDLMFVRKKSIIDYVLQFGYDFDKLSTLSRFLRESGTYSMMLTKDKQNKDNKLKLVCSQHLPEKPVNIIISKDTYEKMYGTKYLRLARS